MPYPCKPSNLWVNTYTHPQSCAPPCARKKEGLGTRLGQYAVDDARARARARAKAIGHIVASNNLVL